MKATFVLAFVVAFAHATTARLEATPIENNGVYKLENQEDGAFLYASDKGVKGGEYSGAQGQKWLFTEAGTKDVYKITPLANEVNDVSSQEWQTILVGHGKRLLKNTRTQLCLQNFGRGRPVQERECGRSNPKQRWYVHTAS